MEYLILFLITWFSSGILSIILYNIFEDTSPYREGEITISHIVNGIIMLVLGYLTLYGGILIILNNNKDKIVFRWKKCKKK